MQIIAKYFTNMFEPTEYYYTLSAIPQILAAMSAVVGAFIFYRLSVIKNLLIGDGKSVLARKNHKLYKEVLDDILSHRIVDAVNRENIIEIKEVLSKLSENEKKLYPLSERPKGFQYVYNDRFCVAEAAYNNIKFYGIATLAFNIITIIISIILLRCAPSVINSCFYNTIFNSIVILFVICCILSLFAVIYSNYQKTIYEDLDKRDNIINRNRNTNNNKKS